MSNLPDFAWNDWGRTQTDRVLDLMDINFLRLATKGIDATSKTMVWNLSQNVDRTTASVQPGICPCLTPSMIPYLTNRGGPLVGLEALSLQGIPVNELLLTRESEDQLADLAGNAMTSTVVGSCTMAAIILGVDILIEAQKKRGEKPVTLEAKKMAVKEHENSLERRVVGCDVLGTEKLDLGLRTSMSMSKVLNVATKSSRHCVCEGRESIAEKPIRKCLDCGHTSCSNCGGRPEHNYDTDNEIKTDARVIPSIFYDMAMEVLPVRLNLAGFSRDELESAAKKADIVPESEVWNEWLNAVSDAIDKAEFRFSSLIRQEIWTATYLAPKAKLLLNIDPCQATWTLFVDRPKGASKTLTDILTRAVAMMNLQSGADIQTSPGFFTGEWDICVPKQEEFMLSVNGTGSLVDSWQSRIGLEECKGAMVWSKYEVSVNEKHKALLKEDISGTYRLVYKCGGAMDSVHTREDSSVRLKLYHSLLPLWTNKLNIV
jgi:hypothetical protein